MYKLGIVHIVFVRKELLMNIIFSNKCRHKVCVEIASNPSFEIQPYDRISISCDEVDKLIIEVRRDIVSYKKRNKYILVLETQYEFENVNDSTEFIITREKARVNPVPDISYDRLFLHNESALCFSEKHSVIGAEEIKKKFGKSRIKEFLLGPFEMWTEALGFLVIGLFLGFFFNWKVSLIFWVVAYIFALIANGVADILFGIVMKKGFKEEGDKKEFYKHFENEFIADYYSNPDRYRDKVEIN